MAEARILSSTCQSSVCVVNREKNGHGVSGFGKSATFFCRSMSFPAIELKLNHRDLLGRKVVVGGARGPENFNLSPRAGAANAQMTLAFPKTQRWWEKGLQPNMREITGAQDLVDSLSTAGDKLVIVDFFSPGCGGCKALHPKICQLAEMNPDVQFLQVNYEEHKSMCYSLNVHVLPFFRFYRGAEGRVCSFSCTNATIKKFKDALAKYGPDRCSLGPPKGLEEKELVALAANRDLSFTYTPRREEPVPVPAEAGTSKGGAGAPELPPLPLPLPLTSTSPKSTHEASEQSLTAIGR